MQKACVNRLLQVFHEFYESSQLWYADQKKIQRRSVNFFPKVILILSLAFDISFIKIRGNKNRRNKTSYIQKMFFL